MDTGYPGARAGVTETGAPPESVTSRLQAFLEALPDEAWMKDVEGRFLVVNERFAAAMDRPREALIGRTDADLVAGDVARPFLETDRRTLRQGVRTVYEHWGTGAAASRRFETIKAPVRDESGRVIGLVGISRDVTERWEREEELRAAERHYRRLAETSPDGIFVTDGAGRVQEANPALCRILGREADDVEGRLFLDFVAPRSRSEVAARQSVRASADATTDIELWIERPSGEERRIHARSTLVVEDGQVAGTHGVVRDVTEDRQRAEAEQRMLDVLEATPDMVAIRDADGHLLYSNRTGRVWQAPTHSSTRWIDVLGAAHPKWAADLVARVGIPAALARGSWTGETAIYGADGREVPISQVIVAGRDAAGEVTHISTIMRDITAIRAREEALERRDAILEAVSMAGTEFLRSADWANAADAGLGPLGKATGASRVSVVRLDRPDDEWHATLAMEWAGPGVAAVLGTGLLDDVPAREAGMLRWVEEFEADRAIHGPVAGLPEAERALLGAQGIRSVAAVPIHVRGELWGMVVFDDCETERHWAPTEIEALRAAAGALGAAIHRRQAEAELAAREEELRHSQKMEAVGRLAGGVAHDFNNMLTAIQGFATLLGTEMADGGRGRAYLDEILRAADRSAALTRQLLAFSRKQVMRPEVLDLNARIGDMEGMLRRLLGETIVLETEPADGLHPVEVDPGQIEQVIMNLSVNSRDAMPRGGTLRIATRNVEVGDGFSTHHGSLAPGAYAELSVQDTGVGLPPDVMDRIFEPFFTTKETGEGTGLGLATVYGIVDQSNGGITVESIPGAGTTFRILFPRCERPPAPVGAGESLPPAAPGAETPATVVVVEDEAAVRRLIRNVLERAGYRVLTAETGLETIAMLRRHDGPVDLLLTDVVMPEMGGSELAAALLSDRPGLRVCFMSGYTEDEVFRHGVERHDENFLEKPFSPDALRDRVAAILSRRG